MFIRKAMVCASIVLGAISLPAGAQQIVGSLEVDIAPPAPRVEVVPAPREGYVWTPGYWRWEAPRREYVWVEGRFQEERRGFRWIADRWLHRESERHYRYEPGHWERVN
jgi:hypothetical protein